MQARTIKVVCGVLALGVAGTGWYAFDTTRTKTTVVTIQTATVTTGDVAEKASASGSVLSPAVASLNFGSSGIITALNIAKGDSVKTGDVLATIDSATAKSSLEQAESGLKTAQARLDQTVAGLSAAERKQLTVQLKQNDVQIETARRNLADAQATIEQSNTTYDAQLETAQQAYDNALANAQTNATNYVTAIDTAQIALNSVMQNVDFSAKTYQGSVDTARAALDNTKKSAELNLKNYQLAVDQALTSLDNTKTNVGFNATALQNAVDLATATLATETAALNAIAIDASPNADKFAQQTKSVAAAANALRSAQLNQASASAKDQQSIGSAQNSALVSAQNSQIAGVEKDQQSIKSAETSLQNALNSQTSGLAKDQQTVKTSEAAVANARNAQTVGIAKDQQTLQSAANSLASAKNSQAASRLKDRQQVASAKASIDSAQLSAQLAKIGNDLKLAPAKVADITSAQGTVLQAKAQVTTATKALADTSIVAPFDGIVTALNSVVGLTSSSGTGSGANASTAVVQLTAVDALQVQVGFSEANAAKITAGQPVTVTFDALPNVSIDTTVKAIDQTATASSGVATYYVNAVVEGAFDQGVRPGMTAQVEVSVKQASGVLLLQSNAVTTRGSRSFVNIQDPKTKVETRTPVEIGVVGETGTEIVSGLTEGQIVVIPRTVIASTRTGANTGFPGGGGNVRVPGAGGGGATGGLGRLG